MTAGQGDGAAGMNAAAIAYASVHEKPGPADCQRVDDAQPARDAGGLAAGIMLKAAASQCAGAIRLNPAACRMTGIADEAGAIDCNDTAGLQPTTAAGSAGAVVGFKAA